MSKYRCQISKKFSIITPIVLGITQGESRLKIQKRPLLILWLSLTISAIAQQRPGTFSGTIAGNVFDSANSAPIEYANVVLYTQRDSIQVTGTITDKNGAFLLTQIHPGMYFIKINFMGYEKKRIQDILIKPDAPDVILGKIKMKPTVLPMEGVEVTADKVPFQYQIDKKVINVSQMQTAVTGTAVDVLENVPSVTVDIDGNVSLRGSENFTVLIDNRPTVLDPNDALQQIPASAIEDIEIITNPSAKHDPDGTAGIINILMKKNMGGNVSGIVNLNAGLDDKSGADFLWSYRTGPVNISLGADYNRRYNPGTALTESQTTHDDLTSYIHSDGSSLWGMTRYGFRGSLEWNLTQSDLVSAGFRYGSMNMNQNSEQNYDEWAQPDMTHIYYISQSLSERTGNFYSANLDYQHQFPRKGHEILAQANLSHRDGDESSSNELLDLSRILTSGQKSTESGPEDRLRLKLDYTLPFNEKAKFEAGFQSRFSLSNDQTSLSEFDSLQAAYVNLTEYEHAVDYKQTIHSLYSTLSNEFGNFGIQAGLRGEYTGREISLVGESQEFSIDRWDIFPTLHTSYHFPGKQQIMASYSRRIERTRDWYLEPFRTWMDAYNVRIGNPALKPEFIDSYELGFQTFFGQNMFSAEFYYRVTHNKVERVQSVYDANVTLHSIENVGSDYAFGSEIMLNTDPFKWLNLNWMANLYKYRIEGNILGEPFSESSFNYNLRFNNTIKITPSTRLQINEIYNSPTATAQGTSSGHIWTNIALKQVFFNKALSVTLQVNDVFQTHHHEGTSEGQDFYRYYRFTRKAPEFMLNVTININNYKTEQKTERNGEEQEGEGGEL
jgi:outer membrane receptor protein involved in Fe transport